MEQGEPSAFDRYLIPLIIGVLVLGGIGVGAYVLLGQSQPTSPPPVSTPRSTLPTAQPTISIPTAAPSTYYIGNSSTKKFHRPGCRWVDEIKAVNKVTFSSRDAAIAAGYQPCKVCNP